MKVLLLGGTSEARQLATALADSPDVDVVSSLAGRVRNPQLPEGTTRIGGFGGAHGLAEWIAHNRVDVVVDATHPFAREISENASTAACAAGVPLVALRRPEWTAGEGDRWIDASSLGAAARHVADRAHRSDASTRAFLTIGRQGVSAFADVEHVWFLVRSIDPPSDPLPPQHRIMLSRGPFDVDTEIATMRAHRIDMLVTKNSGGGSTAAKLLAARALGISVVMITRPPLPECDMVAESTAGVVEWLQRLP